MSKTKILLVQNAQTQGNSTKSSLESADYEVVWAGNGASALSAAVHQSVALILIDVALPDMEGADLCRLFRVRDATAEIPIIMLTARGYMPALFQQSPHGPDDYLAKPCSGGELDARISAVLNTKKLKTELELKNRLLNETLAQVETLAIIDPETGLYNRKQFGTLFSKEFKRALRYKQLVSCMRIDLDGRQENEKADEGVVKAIVQLIQKTIREVDTAAWWTGQGFIVLIPNTTREHAVQAAARVLVAVADHPFTWSDSRKVALSIGVAGLPDSDITTETKLVEAADNALFQARQFMLVSPMQIPVKGAGNGKSVVANVSGKGIPVSD